MAPDASVLALMAELACRLHDAGLDDAAARVRAAREQAEAGQAGKASAAVREAAASLGTPGERKGAAVRLGVHGR
jgi:hypothetical protein